MAIINSLGVGAGQKSAGNLTYRRTRGRTIASQRITTNKSNSAAQQDKRMKFGYLTEAIKKLAFIINMSCEKSKFGSSRNNWMKRNASLFINAEYTDDLESAAHSSTPYEVVEALYAFLDNEGNTLNRQVEYTIGSANGVVSMTFGDSGAASAMSATLYAPKAQCSVSKITLTSTGGVTMSDVTETLLTEDASGMYCTATAEGEEQTSSSYDLYIFKINDQIVSGSAWIENPGSGSPGEV